jgi:two-component system chemotaxis response regulator CheB
MSLNSAGITRDIIAVGASAGGVEAAVSLLSTLSADLPAIVAFVIHRGPQPSALVSVLARRSRIPVHEVEDCRKIEKSNVYIAPPDRHLFFQDSALDVAAGPREHSSRPAVDPLFESAARVHGQRVVGVLLSGSGRDGAAGLLSIKRAGGITLVQDLDEARVPFMPRAAIAAAAPDAMLPVEEIARALDELARGRPYSRAH